MQYNDRMIVSDELSIRTWKGSKRGHFQDAIPRDGLRTIIKVGYGVSDQGFQFWVKVVPVLNQLSTTP
jgi:hypothetical protein